MPTTPEVAKVQPEHRIAIQRLLESQTFASAPRLRDVLSYLLRMLEEGTSEEISEQTIGQMVFNKPPGYNASEENIVRVTVRHLRARLEEYYASEGASDPIALVIPKGKYVPVFFPREIPGGQKNDGLAPSNPIVQPAFATTGATEDSVPVSLFSSKGPRLLRLGFLIALLISLAFGAGYAYRSYKTSSVPGTGVIGDLFRPGADVTLVTVDANLQAYRQIFGMQVNLDDYISRSYTHAPLNSSDPRILNAQRFSSGANETNVSSVIIATFVKQALRDRRLVIKHPHDASVRDFQNQGNVILLGGPWSDPWGQLFENRFNFRILPQQDSPSTPEVHNLHPAAGEALIYHPHKDGDLNVDYVRIAILPNLDNSGHVILLSATSAESLEAAGAYLVSEKSERQLLDRFHIKNIAELPPVEFLLETKGLNAAPESHRILATRVVQ